jgi:FkbM family methyltransferase
MKLIIKESLSRWRPALLRLKHLLGLASSVDELEIAIDFLSGNLTDINSWHSIDIGFHRGESSTKLLKVFGGVLAFEPSQTAINQASKNTIRDPRLDLRNQAISHSAGLAKLYLSKTSTGISSLVCSGSLHQASVEIETVTLNNALKGYRENDLSKVACIKIDVEGMECEILGQISSIQDLRPPILLSEFQDLKSTYGDLKRQLEIGFEMGYWCVISVWKPVVQYGCAHEWERFVPVDSLEHVDAICSYLYSGWGNLIFVEPSLYTAFLSSLSEYELRKKK